MRPTLKLLFTLTICVLLLTSCGHKSSFIGQWTLKNTSPPGSTAVYEFKPGHQLTISQHMSVGSTSSYVVTNADYHVHDNLLTEWDNSQTTGLEPGTQALIRRRLARIDPHFESAPGSAAVTTPLAQPPIVYTFQLTDHSLTLQQTDRPAQPALRLSRLTPVPAQ